MVRVYASRKFLVTRQQNQRAYYIKKNVETTFISLI